MTFVPAWATAHLEKHLPAGNPVVNAQAVRRNMILANTRLGAVLVRRGLLSGVRHVFLEVPSQKTAFRCSKCLENLQFYNLDIPADVYCSICAAKYHVDGEGKVTDGDLQALPAEFKPKQLHPFPPVWDVAPHVRETSSRRGRGKGTGSTGGGAAKRPRAGAPYRHAGFTLYARETATKGGAHTLYFFSKGTPKSGEPSPLPDGYAVGSNQRTGLPFLRRAAGAAAPEPEAMPAKAQRPRKAKRGAGSRSKGRKPTRRRKR